MVEGAKLLGEALRAGARDRRRVRRRRGRRRRPSGTWPPACGRAGARVRELQPGVLAPGRATPSPLSPWPPSCGPSTFRLRQLGRPEPDWSWSASRCATPAISGRSSAAPAPPAPAAVVCCAGSVDLYNPKTVRASAGVLFHVPGGRRSPTPWRSSTQLGALGPAPLGRQSPGGERDYTDVDLAAAGRPGARQRGVGPGGPGRSRCLDGTLRIPMAGAVESLNVATHRGRGVLRGSPAAGRAGGRWGAGRDEAATGPRATCSRTRSWCWTGCAASAPSTTPPAV